AGNYRYHALTPEALGDIRTIGAFEHTGTRELTAHDYVYQIRRLASPRVVSPIYAQMSEHIVGLREYGEHLRALDASLREQGRAHEWLDLREHGFDGVQALDDHTLRIRVRG